LQSLGSCGSAQHTVSLTPYVLSNKGDLWGERHWNDLRVRCSVEVTDEGEWDGSRRRSRRERKWRAKITHHPHNATVPPYMSTAMTGISLAAPQSLEDVIGAMKDV
jgi:hypothetical protein